jgi:deoxyribonuclease-4
VRERTFQLYVARESFRAYYGLMINFGPAGVPTTLVSRKPEHGIREVARLGLDCMEIEFVRGVRMGDEAAARVNQARKETGITLTAHGPYYINLCSQEADKAEASVERILETARRCFACGGVSITFHAAYYQDRNPELIFRMVAERLRGIRQRLEKEGVRVAVAPELTGRPSQFGSLPELVRLCREVPGIRPCIDFAHFVARQNGASNNYEGFRALLSSLKQGLGPGALKDLHMHVSGIEWGSRGERKHHRLKESKFDWEALLQALVDMEVSGVMVCESPVMEEDALILKQEYQRRKNII